MMIFEKWEITEISEGPATLRAACDKVPEGHEWYLADEEFIIYPGSGPREAANGSGVQSALIHEAGRWCEKYASDLIMVLSELEPFLFPVSDGEAHRWVIGAGMYADGIHGSNSVMCCLKESARLSMFGFADPARAFRKLLAIDITDTPEDGHVRRVIALKDITHTVGKIAPEDEEARDER